MLYLEMCGLEIDLVFTVEKQTDRITLNNYFWNKFIYEFTEPNDSSFRDKKLKVPLQPLSVAITYSEDLTTSSNHHNQQNLYPDAFLHLLRDIEANIEIYNYVKAWKWLAYTV